MGIAPWVVVLEVRLEVALRVEAGVWDEGCSTAGFEGALLVWVGVASGGETCAEQSGEKHAGGRHHDMSEVVESVFGGGKGGGGEDGEG